MKGLFYLIYYWIIFMPIFLALTILTALTTVIGCLLGGERIFSYYPGMFWSRLVCYLSLCKVKVSGRENISKDRSYVFIANHQGAFDIFLIYGFLGIPIKWVMKRGIEKLPFVGLACKAAGFIFVDNRTPKSAAKSVLEAERAVKKGSSLVLFPEGSRSKDGHLQRFKKGAYQIAVDQHLPLIPISINGPFHVLPIGSILVHPGRMEMIIHPEVQTDDSDRSHQGLQMMADSTKAIIASGLWPEFR